MNRELVEKIIKFLETYPESFNMDYFLSRNGVPYLEKVENAKNFLNSNVKTGKVQICLATLTLLLSGIENFQYNSIDISSKARSILGVDTSLFYLGAWKNEKLIADYNFARLTKNPQGMVEAAIAYLKEIFYEEKEKEEN